MGAKEEVQEGLSSLAAKVFSLRENFRVGALILARSFPFPQPSVFCWGNTRGGGVFLCLLDPALWMRSGHGDWGVGGPRCEVGTGVVAQGEETPSLGCSSLGGGNGGRAGDLSIVILPYESAKSNRGGNRKSQPL